MGAAARLVDAIAHRWAGGRWLATGGGGYGVYRVVPRAWAHVWLAGAHREVPDRLPAEWRDRWADEAARYGDRSLPETFDDPPNAGLPFDAEQRDAEARSLATAELAAQRQRSAAHPGGRGPRLVVAARAAAGRARATARRAARRSAGRRSSTSSIGRRWIGSRSRRASSRISTPGCSASLLASPALSVTMAVDGATAVGLVASAPDDPAAPDPPTVRPRGRRRACVAAAGAGDRGCSPPTSRRSGSAGTPWTATVTLAERDPVEPLDRALRSAIAARIYERAGFSAEEPDRRLRLVDPGALRFVRR